MEYQSCVNGWLIYKSNHEWIADDEVSTRRHFDTYEEAVEWAKTHD